MQKAVVLVEQVLFAVASVRSTRGIGQSSDAGTPIDSNDSVYEGPSPLSMLLDAKCDPNNEGIAQQSPRLYAVGLQNNNAVEDLLIARADMNYAPAGLEPPLCVAIRHRMGDIAKTLLTYTADVTV